MKIECLCPDREIIVSDQRKIRVTKGQIFEVEDELGKDLVNQHRFFREFKEAKPKKTKNDKENQ